MAKYDPLKVYLKKISLSMNEVALSFDQISEILQSDLPYSAYNHSAWWSNETDGRHVQAHAWQDAGWNVESVNLDKRRVRFIQINTI